MATPLGRRVKIEIDGVDVTGDVGEVGPLESSDIDLSEASAEILAQRLPATKHILRIAKRPAVYGFYLAEWKENATGDGYTAKIIGPLDA